MAIDGKYGRVTTEFGDIGADEPVIIFRAQDGTVPAMLKAYRSICEQAGSPDFHLGLIDQARETVERWQADPANYVRNPPTSEGPAGQRLR